MSNHMSEKAINLHHQQLAGAKLRRLLMAESRAGAFETRRIINQARGLEIKREKTIARRIERVAGFLVFLYLQAMGFVYLAWLTGYW